MLPKKLGMDRTLFPKKTQNNELLTIGNFNVLTNSKTSQIIQQEVSRGHLNTKAYNKLRDVSYLLLVEFHILE